MHDAEASISSLEGPGGFRASAVGFAGAGPLWVNWGPALLSSQGSEQNPKGGGILEGQGRHICFGDGPFFLFVCCFGRPERTTEQGYL